MFRYDLKWMFYESTNLSCKHIGFKVSIEIYLVSKTFFICIKVCNMHEKEKKCVPTSK